MPEPPGVKLKSRVQVDPEVKLAPHVLFASAKSLAFVPVIGMPEIFKVLELKLAKVAVSGPFVIPKSNLGGVKLISVWQPAMLMTVGLKVPPLDGFIVPAPMKVPMPRGLNVNWRVQLPRRNGSGAG